MKMERWGWLVLFGAIGMGIGMTNLLAPFHEAAHVASAARDGVNAQITGWNTAIIYGTDFKALMAGWTWELILSVIFAVVLSFVGRHYPKIVFLTGGFFIGYALTTWLRAFTSYDFNQGMYLMIQRYVNDESLMPQVWAEVHHGINVRWAWTGVISLMIGLAFTIRNSVKERSYHGKKESWKESRI
jgi:hypothetical protein